MIFGCMELVIAAVILSGREDTLVSGAAAVIFGVFTSIAFLHGRRSVRDSCGCLGAIDLRLGWASVVLNALLTIGASLTALGSAFDFGRPGTGNPEIYLAAMAIALTYWVTIYSMSVLHRVSTLRMYPSG